jgi:hypothetical protein
MSFFGPDLQALFAVFGEDATLGVASVRGVLDEKPRDEYGIIGGNAPRFTMKTADLPADPRAVTLTVGARTFAVRDWVNDGTGVSTLQLEL